MSSISNIVRKFIADHPEELVDGKLKVAIGGGAGFIGSHIAKQLRSDVSTITYLAIPFLPDGSFDFYCFTFVILNRAAMSFARTGRTMSS